MNSSIKSIKNIYFNKHPLRYWGQERCDSKWSFEPGKRQNMAKKTEDVVKIKFFKELC